ncbi:hypothetical protein FB45DRAFT_155743 [Roridomyces roridus]|uniref:Uncharacterized protein n=1 Tax=Roridomyces roridus TaxID=1738132 RepID=A0AAD7BEX4_9AGAR|nr:hypothetical protein FB45DRAFT_155743 [Roridomyces roridus]
MKVPAMAAVPTAKEGLRKASVLSTPSDSHTYTTNTLTPSNTHTYTPTTNTQTNTPITPPSLRRPAQGSPPSSLSSVRNIVALWKECTPRKSPSASGFSSSSSSASDESSSSGRPEPNGDVCNDKGLPLPAVPTDPEEDGLFAMRRRAWPDDTATLPPGLNIAELNAYAQSNEPPRYIGILWFLNVHVPPPYRWQRCQALLYPHLLLLSWLAPGGGRGIVGLDLVEYKAVQSTPSPSHPAARDDVGYEGRYWTKVFGPPFWRPNPPDLARSGQISSVLANSDQIRPDLTRSDQKANTSSV